MRRGLPGKARSASFMPTSLCAQACVRDVGVTTAGSLTEAVCLWEQPWSVCVQVIRDRSELTQQPAYIFSEGVEPHQSTGTHSVTSL